MTLETSNLVINMWTDDTTLHTYGIDEEEIVRKLNHDANTLTN